MARLEKFFALSTCIHCKHTREFFEEHKVPFTPLYVDKMGKDDRSAAMKEVAHYNPQQSFPTLVFSDNNVIVGFKPDEIKKELNL